MALALDAACDWDEEAIAEAYTRAEAIEDFDPEAAAMLRAQAREVEAQRYGVARAAQVQTSYDPMKLYARMGMKYPWMTDEVIDRMHFPKFFAYVREAHIMAEEEQAAYERARRGGGTSNNTQTLSPEEEASAFPRAQVYDGEVIPL